ncbi:MAG: transglutaminase family protein [Pseudolysinimonas sp.]
MMLEVVGSTAFMLAVSTAQAVPLESEKLTVLLDGEPIATRELPDLHGTRLQLFETTSGVISIDYRAVVAGRAPAAPVVPLDAITYLRPSRYVQSDTLQPFARRTFGNADGADLVRAVGNWVHERLSYEPGATSPTGGAVETLESGAGVCRDYAHLTAALLRGLDVPARLVSVYAAQLTPPDFHAVVEALVDGRWVVVDATRLAPRRGLVRMATGRDATDTAFLTNTLADIHLTALRVEALSDEVLIDDPDELVELG